MAALRSRSLWLAVLAAVSCACCGAVGDTGTGNFAEQLFQDGLQYAEESLRGRFIRQLVEGTLPRSVFKLYLRQDNLYLTKYARAFAVMAAKVDTTDELRWLVGKASEYMQEHGPNGTLHIDERTFEREALPTTMAYTSFLMEAAWGEDLVLSYAAVLPCQRLYDWLFSLINATIPIAPDNPYKEYISQYADPANHRTSREMEAFLNNHAAHGMSAELRGRAQVHYRTALKYEADFFDQALQHCAQHGCPAAVEATLNGRAVAPRALGAVATTTDVRASSWSWAEQHGPVAAWLAPLLAAVAVFAVGRHRGMHYSFAELRRSGIGAASATPLVFDGTL